MGDQQIMSNIDKGIWDPNEIGPFDRCSRCFTEFTDNYAFCSHCGRISTVFQTQCDASEDKCHNHPSRNAIGYCCLCSQPICVECNNEEKQHFSFTAGFRDLFYCHECMDKCKAIEKTFLEKISKSGFCAKHHDHKAAFKCIKCGSPICPYCSYFKNAGWFRRKLGEGPYCLRCFRSATYKGGRSRWISGKEALEKKWVTKSLA